MSLPHPPPIDASGVTSSEQYLLHRIAHSGSATRENNSLDGRERMSELA